MKKNQKGFGAIGILVVIIIVGLIAAVGWLVYERQSSKKTDNSSATNNTSKEASTKNEESPRIPEGYSKNEVGDTGLSLVYPSNWGKVKQVSEAKGGGYELNGMSLKIQKDTSVQIARSFNAPSYCSYNAANNEWVKSGEYPPNTCEPSVLKVSAIKANGFSKGALGAYGYTYGINLKGDTYLLVGDALLADGTPEKSPESYPSLVDSEKLKAELDKNIEVILSNNQELFE